MPIKNARPIVKKVDVSEEFYKIFSENEVINIINDLKFKRQIKHKYDYYGSGAKAWDEFYFTSPLTQILTEMRPIIMHNILYYIGDSDLCNFIDIGPGNAHPMKNWLQQFIELNIMNNYVAVDISPDINCVIQNNINSWFPKIQYREYVRDIETEEITGLLIENKMNITDPSIKIANIIVNFGNTMCVHDDRLDALKNMSKGMDTSDILIFSYTTDTPNNKIAHKYVSNKSGEAVHGWIPAMLGLNYDLKLVETSYNPAINAKVKSLTLDADYIINFKVFGGIVPVQLYKGEKIDLWRHYLISMDNLGSDLEEARLEPLLHMYDKTRSNAMVICRTKDVYNRR